MCKTGSVLALGGSSVRNVSGAVRIAPNRSGLIAILFLELGDSDLVNTHEGHGRRVRAPVYAVLSDMSGAQNPVAPHWLGFWRPRLAVNRVAHREEDELAHAPVGREQLPHPVLA